MAISLEKAYKYSAKTTKGKITSGVIYAKSSTGAFSKLKKMGFQPLKVSVDPIGSIGATMKKGFSMDEVARLYMTLGRRLNNGKSIIEGLESSMDYLSDQRLRQATMAMKQSITDGNPEHQAMRDAGFSFRDSMIIKATSEAGKTGDTFVRLANEIKRTEGLRRSVKSIFRMPIIMGVMMLIFFYAAVVFVSPQTQKFLKQTGLKVKLNALTQAYFDFANWFNANLVLGTILFLSFPLGIFLFVKSKYLFKVIDKIKRVREISIKSDMSALWNSFALLYDASIPIKEACKILSAAAVRPDSSASFRAMGKYIEAGRPMEEAVELSKFPDFIEGSVKAAVSSGNLFDGLLDMVSTLEEDVNMSTEILKEQVKLYSTFMVAIGLGIIFFVTYYPMVASVLSNI